MGILSRLFGRDEPPAPTPRTPREEAKAAFTRGKNLFFHEQRYGDAALAFATAVELAPDSVDSQFLLGASLLRSGATQESIGPLRRCVELDPNHADGHNALGMALGRLEHHVESDRHIARAAYLGHVQAPQTLKATGMDYCRQCRGPTHAADDVAADILVVAPGIGWACAACRTVLCHLCAGENVVGLSPACPRCRTQMTPLLR